MNSETRITAETRGGLLLAWALASLVTIFIGIVLGIGLRRLDWSVVPDFTGLRGFSAVP